MAADDRGKLGIGHRIFAAGGASVLSVLVTTPLDVVKNRMQAQQAAAVEGRLPSPSLQRLAIAGCPDVCPRVGNPILPPLCAPNCYIYESTFDGIRKIVRQEGAAVLWRGTNASLLTAGPMVGMYMPLYDFLVQRMAQIGVLAPVVAGSIARMVSMFFVAPLDLLRTRMQVSSSVLRVDSRRRVGRTGSALLQRERPSSWRGQFDWGQGLAGRTRMLWRGYGAAVMRDVPFSAVYWGLLEPIRAEILANHIVTGQTHCDVLVANTVAGAAAGSVAAFVTTPFDVVKTRQQVALQSKGAAPPGVWQLFSDISRREGLRGLFSGVGPRVARAAPACAIVLSTYEVLKTALMEHQHQNHGH